MTEALPPDLRALADFRTNFPLYARACLRIRTKSGGIEPLALNKAQVYLHKRLEAQRARTGRVRALCLKGRQQGISTYVEGRFYHRTSGDFGVRAFILTHEDAATANLFEMAERYHQFCPPELRPHTGANNAKELNFDRLQSGYKVATAGTKGAGRSATAQLFHGSEVAFWPHAKEHMAGIMQTVSAEPGTEIILESTANGPTGVFYEMWQAAERGDSDFEPVFIPWYWQAEYAREPGPEFELSADDLEYQEAYGLTDAQMAWRRAKIVTDFQGDVGLFDQEYPADAALAFQVIAGQVLINATKVALAAKPKPDLVRPVGRKILGVDPAEYGDDHSAIIRRQGRKAWGLKRRKLPELMELVGIVAHEADLWRKEDGKPVDHIVVDCTGVGAGVASRLRELGYPVVRFMAGSGAIDEEHYIRRGDEAWGLMRDWIEDDEPTEIENDPVLKSDLMSRTFSYDSARRVKLTPKERIKADGGKSPDAGDALSMTFATHANDEVSARGEAERIAAVRQRMRRGKVV